MSQTNTFRLEDPEYGGRNYAANSRSPRAERQLTMSSRHERQPRIGMVADHCAEFPLPSIATMRENESRRCRDDLSLPGDECARTSHHARTRQPNHPASDAGWGARHLIGQSADLRVAESSLVVLATSTSLPINVAQTHGISAVAMVSDVCRVTDTAITYELTRPSPHPAIRHNQTISTQTP